MKKDNWKKNQNYLRFDGSTPLTKRADAIGRFNSEPNQIIFLISSKAGGQGINLVTANRIVLMDSNWNPTIDCKLFINRHSSYNSI